MIRLMELGINGLSALGGGFPDHVFGFRACLFWAMGWDESSCLNHLRVKRCEGFF